MYERDSSGDPQDRGAGVRYCEFVPAAELRPFVRCYWVFQTDAGVPVSRHERYVPSALSSLLFHLRGTFWCARGVEPGGRPLAGLQLPRVVAVAAARRPLHVRAEGTVTLRVGVCLHAGASRALELFSPDGVQGICGLDDRWTEDFLSRLEQVTLPDRSGVQAATLPVNLAASGSAQAGLAAVLDACLLRRRIVAATPEWSTIESYLFKRNGCITMREFVRLNGGSLRGLERACRRETGYTPSEYRALVRCDLARRALRRSLAVDLSGLACDLGFFDLAHFCRTFKRWVGLTPSQYSACYQPLREATRGEPEVPHEIL